MTRGVRGAIQAAENHRDSILKSASQLMQAIIQENGIKSENVSSVLFTVTPDLNAAFPAEVRKELGWDLVPFLCGQEISVPDTLPHLIRVLVLFDTEKTQQEIRHQYLGAAASLRPDLKKS